MLTLPNSDTATRLILALIVSASSFHLGLLVAKKIYLKEIEKLRSELHQTRMREVDRATAFMRALEKLAKP